MSSDSELDEFFDAEDITPNISCQHTDEGVNENSEKEALAINRLLEIEHEEEELRLLKERAAERRRLEDDEIAKRLDELQRRKERVSDSGQPDYEFTEHIEHPAVSQVTKLRLLRQQMSEDIALEDFVANEGTKSIPPNSTKKIDSDVKIEISDSFSSKASDTVADGVLIYGHLSHASDGRSVTSGHHIRQQDESINVNMKETQTTLTHEEIHELVREVCEAANTTAKHGYHSRSTSAMKESPLCESNVTCVPRMSSGVGVTKSSSFPVYEIGPTINEPDIIKSTRLTPPQTLTPAPVAPVRRKKKHVLSSPMSQNGCKEISNGDRSSNVCQSLEPESSRSLPTQYKSQVSSSSQQSYGPCAASDYSLDVHSAMSGLRHIHADDVAIDSTHVDVPSARVNSLDRHQILNRKSSTASFHASCDGGFRPRSSSGRLLTDEEILESVIVLNLDTGEQVPLSVAEEKLPQCINPLALHIMRRTKEYNSHSSLNKAEAGSDGGDESDVRSESGRSTGSVETSTKLKVVKIKKLIGKSVKSSMKKVKQVAEQSKKGIAEVLEGDDTEMENEVSVDGKKFKFKRSRGNKGPYKFAQFRILQDINGHTGPIWTMEFSPCGRLLATGGQDCNLKVWVLKSCYSFFDEMRQKCNEDPRLSPGQSKESINKNLSSTSLDSMDSDERKSCFMKRPFWIYTGHTADLLDIAWSKNNFILSSSMDKTVRLWHISRKECLCTFQHIDFVTVIVFHPRDDRYFLSGSLDGNLRLWNIPDKRVTLRNEVTGPSTLITTANFCDNGGYAVVGMYDGRCILFYTDKLKYYTQINIRSSRGKNHGRKVTGVEPVEIDNKSMMLVTTNDSRIRLYDLRDLSLMCKYKGHINISSLIKASFSGDGKSIICGSEDHFVYVWKTQHDLHRISSARRDRNHYWEAIKVHNAVVTAAIFAPKPSLFSRSKDDDDNPESPMTAGELIISADFAGSIKIVQNHPLPVAV